ncbi:metallophosphoesterase [Nannocystis pusilla]|uniref:metallophosphoesterase n=1 Tax=Nannocystis pusilla TaxID=889268 RepID=UPI003B812123
MQSTLIIGDIHGCHAELLDLLDRAAIGDDDLVVSVGDLVDRGPDPASVVELFRARPNSLALCGNHERKHIRGVLSYSQQVAKLQLGADYEDHVRWMATLPYHWERDDVRVVHWGSTPGCRSTRCRRTCARARRRATRGCASATATGPGTSFTPTTSRWCSAIRWSGRSRWCCATGSSASTPGCATGCG